MGFIYLIQNNINGKSYVGQTHYSIEERWKQHLYEKDRSNCLLYRAMRKYGAENFTISQIEECNNDLLDEREIYWIKQYGTFLNGYNMTLGGDGVRKIDHDLVVKHFQKKRMISQTAKDLNIGLSTVRRCIENENIEYGKDRSLPKKIVMIDVQTLQPLRYFNSITEAANSQDGWKRETIRDAVSGRRLSAYGYFWKQDGEEKEFSQKLFKHTRKIAQLDPKTGEIIHIYSSIAEASRSVNKPKGASCISNVLAGKNKTAYGYRWKYIDD